MNEQPTDADPGEQPDQPAQAHEQPDNDGTDWKAEARKWEARARQNNGKASAAEHKATQLTQAIAQALGIEKAPDDPKALADNLTAAQRETADAHRQLAVYRAAARNGANPDALVDSASFLRSIAQVDPTDADAIAQAIKQAVEQNPALAAGTQPGAGYRDTTAGRGNPMQSDADTEALRTLGFL